MTNSQVTVEDLLDLRALGAVDVSNDGQRVAFVVDGGATAKGKLPESRVWIADADGDAREATRGPGSDSLPRWSPDGRQLAFASDRDHAGLMGLHLLDFRGEARTVGDLPGSVEDIRWSRDGSYVLVLAADPGSDKAGGQAATKIQEHDGDEQDPIVRRPNEAWRRLYRIDLDSGATTELSPLGSNVWEFGWSGGGQVVAVVSDDPTESAWFGAHVALLDLDTREARSVYEPDWQLQSPVISADGRHVAFVEGLASDRMIVTGTTTVVELASGAVNRLAPDHDVVTLRWLDRDRLFYVGTRGIETMCGRIALDGTVDELWSGPASIGTSQSSAAACSADARTVAAAKDAPGEPPELCVLAGDGWRTLTSVNAALADRTVPDAERFVWSAGDGVEIEGILLRPAERGDEPLPLVVQVHGGPTATWTLEFSAGPFGMGVALGNAGYAVLLPNPRGSTGRGQAFSRANLGDMGGGDLQDILAGVDALVEAGIADRERVGITGGSYGGFMSAWAITQTDAFAAAIPCACISNWLSFHNTSNVGRWDELYLQSDPYDPAGDYFARSPVMHARACTTPTLLLHGELDLCTPLGQAEEMYQALVDAGCEAELVIYPRGGHGWWERDHRRDTLQRMLAWFAHHLTASRSASLT